MKYAIEMYCFRKTKNTFVFGTDDDSAMIPTLYIKKSAFPDGTEPTKITVTITTES